MHRQNKKPIYFFALLSFFIGARAQAQQKAEPLSITVSGGVSLGSYQAGFLYYLSEAMREDPSLGKIVLVSGASAGATNALLTAMASCSFSNAKNPDESIFWKVWTPVGLSELYRPNEVTALNVFSRAALHHMLDDIAVKWKAGLKKDCDIVLGIAATRASADDMQLDGAYARVPHAEERFLLRIQGQGSGRAPKLTNYSAQQSAVGFARLIESNDGTISFENLRRLLLASAAFPIAFSPQDVGLCPASDRNLRCTRANAQVVPLIDGGLFDAKPLRLSATAAAAGLEPRGLRWRNTPDFSQRVVPDALKFLLVDIDSNAYPSLEDDVVRPAALVPLLGQLASSFIRTARAKELVTLFETNPEVRSRMTISQAYLPRASEPMGAFFGFFERSFREYDFTMGMVDAHRYLLQHGMKNRAPMTETSNVKWQAFECAVSVLENHRGSTLCHKPELLDFRILLQVSIDRLYHQCAEIKKTKGAKSTDHVFCQAAQKGEAPIRLIAAATGKHVWPLDDSHKDDVSLMLTQLSAYKFWFRDLGLSRDRADEAPYRVSTKVNEMGQQFAKAQGSTGQLVRIGIRLASYQISYVPPRNSFYFLVGRMLMLGWSHTDPLSRWNWLRIHTALSFDSISTLLSSEPSRFALTPYVGIEIDPKPLNTATVQWHTGLSLGYRMSTEQAADGAQCATGALCSGTELQAHVAASFLTVVRLQIAGSWWPQWGGANEGRWQIVPLLGFQLDDPL